jgi:hypothetical protein
VLTGHDVDLLRLPFHPQHAFDGSCYLSAAMEASKTKMTDMPRHGVRR